ncbi:MAG: pyridoxal-phosphate dependent enzyme [Planctomycetota bacterium]|nr:pyridoxal-phosphate dependent enzyme [Planctomycetota bacterium]
MSIWNWQHAFESVPPGFQLSLGEADTPLIPSRFIGPNLGLNQLYFKLEMCNPTGSFKDRYAAVAISHMLAKGQTKCLATSSGNTGASLAAYCAMADIQCEIAVVETAPQGKLQQMLGYGATIYRIQGFGADPEITQAVFETLNQAAEQDDAALQVSAFCYSPLGMSGIKSISHELNGQVPQQIEHVFCQAGGGGLAMGAAQGFLDLQQRGTILKPPQVHIVQPEGNDTMASALRDGKTETTPVDSRTKISGLQVASITDGTEAVRDCRATRGNGFLVTDAAVWECQKTLAEKEGVFCEPAAAVSVVGAMNAFEMGHVKADEVVICPITGSGFKDPSSVDRMNQQRDCPRINHNQFKNILSR